MVQGRDVSKVSQAKTTKDNVLLLSNSIQTLEFSIVDWKVGLSTMDDILAKSA